MDARNSNALTLTLPSDREIVFTRVFDAPRRLVFEAWTKSEHVVRWWGCRDTTMSVCDIDLRIGGAYRLVMRGPDDVDHPLKGVYREIVPPERLVYTQIYDVEPWSKSEALVTVTFAERDGRTTLTSRISHPSIAARNAHLASGMERGAAETMDRLAEFLRTTA